MIDDDEFFSIDIEIFISFQKFEIFGFFRLEPTDEGVRYLIFFFFFKRSRRGVGVSGHVEGEQHAQPGGKVARPAENQRRGQLQMLHLRANFEQFVEFGAERGCLLHGIDQR